MGNKNLRSKTQNFPFRSVLYKKRHLIKLYTVYANIKQLLLKYLKINVNSFIYFGKEHPSIAYLQKALYSLYNNIYKDFGFSIGFLLLVINRYK